MWIAIGCGVVVSFGVCVFVGFCFSAGRGSDQDDAEGQLAIPEQV
jgi:hypothetical protein